MDDLVVIIITLVIVVVGALGQIKKKKPLQQNPDQQNKPPGFWDLLKEDMVEYQGQQPEYTTIEEPATEPEFKGENPDYQFTGENETKSVFAKVKNKLKKEEKGETKTKEKFSLRKAVIYSEILNRKYT